ncbi:MAG: dephospho-CoA kinase [Bacteroidia bacterium]|nr:dephospho-CoA kinase [Bacteroidia bacterium]MDW8015255.1 dephospho-CoA kinase [Bacteroidia bacterium]
MLLVGLTGGIGTGKTYILQRIAVYGYPTYSADQRAKALMEEDAELKKHIQALLGKEAYTPEGKLHRSFVAERIFQDASLRQKINQLVHPRTGLDFLQWVEERRQEGHKAVFKEAALTIEAGAFQGLDCLVMIYAPLQVRLERLRRRGDLSPEETFQRLRAQWPEWRKIAYADFVIVNDGILPLEPQLVTLFQQLHLPLPTTFA